MKHQTGMTGWPSGNILDLPVLSECHTRQQTLKRLNIGLQKNNFRNHNISLYTFFATMSFGKIATMNGFTVIWDVKQKWIM